MENPKIRFKGFTKDWEQRKLNEVAEKICVGFVGTCEKFYTDESGIPMYRTGNLNGLSLNRDDLKYVTNEFHQHNQKSQLKAGDILIARHGDSGKAVNYENSEEANCLNIVIIRPDFKKCNYKFLTNCINSPECQKHIKSLSAGSTQAVINTSEIEKLGVVIPANIDEQNRIARYFSTLDHLITLHQRKCEQTKKLKKYMLQKMFPQNGAKVPKIRFYGFTYDWEQRKFSELVTIERGGSPRPIDKFITNDENGLNWVKIGDAPEQGNYITQTAEKIRPEGLSKTREVHPGDLILSNSMSFGRPYIMAIDGCIHDGWLAIRDIKKNFDLKFLCTLLGTDGMLNQYKAMAAGSTVNNLNKELVGGTTVTFPMVEEQIKMGDYFTTLDNLITLHQRKCDELKKMKKYMLQNMFI